MKKILILLVVVVMLISCFAFTACGEKPTETNPGTNNTPTEEGAHAHIYGEWKVVKEPTCTEPGLEKRECGCGQVETREIPAKGHTPGKMGICLDCGMPC